MRDFDDSYAKSVCCGLRPPSGLRDVLCRIPVDVEYGGIVQYVSRTSDDAVAIQPQQLSLIHI